MAMIEQLVEQIEARFAELGRLMTDPDVIADRERYAQVGREYSQLEPAAKLAAPVAKPARVTARSRRLRVPRSKSSSMRSTSIRMA